MSAIYKLHFPLQTIILSRYNMNNKQTSLFGFLNRKKPDPFISSPPSSVPPKPVQVPPPNPPSNLDFANKDPNFQDDEIVQSTTKRLKKKADLLKGPQNQFIVPTPKQQKQSESQDIVYEKFVIGTIEEEQEKDREKLREQVREIQERKKEKPKKSKPLTEEQKKKIREEAKQSKKLKESAQKPTSLLDEIEGYKELNQEEQDKLLLLTYQLEHGNRDKTQVDKDHLFALQLAEEEQRVFDQAQRKRRQEEQILPKQFQKLRIQTPQKQTTMIVQQPSEQKKSSKKPTKRVSKSRSNSKDKNKGKSRGKSKEPPAAKTTIQSNGNDCFSGLTFVMTGEFKHDKNLIQNVVLAHGGRITGTVSGKTDYLLQGYASPDGRPISTTNNSVKAAQFKKKIVPHDSLDEFFKQQTGKSLGEHLGVKPKLAVKEYEGIVKEEDEFAMWCQRYAPKGLNEVIGQQGPINKARKWIESWEQVHYKGHKHNINKNFTGFFYPKGDLNSKAMMFSGPPGIGKTTVARLLAQQYGYNVVQYNASDTRNKSSVTNIQASSYSLNFSKDKQKILMILDEVDGLSGGDRGGSAAMIQLIKKSFIPIICICNDRQSTKIKSLGGHCYDVSFEEPNKESVLKRLNWILNKRGITYSRGDLMEIIETFHSDMRQILNFLNMHCLSNAGGFKDSDSKAGNYTKNDTSLMNMWDAGNKLLNKTEFAEMSMPSRLELFFVDSEFIPLIIQNCLKYSFNIPKQHYKEKRNYDAIRMKWDYSAACDSISFGDIVNASIRRNQDWKMMPIYGYLSSVFPTQLCAISGKAVFPQWLGNNSKARKIARQLRELEHSFKWTTFGGSRKSTKDYAKTLYHMLHHKLKEAGDTKGSKKDNYSMNEAVGLMSAYRITPTMLKENMIDVQYQGTDLMSDIPAYTKAALTKLFNERYNASKTTFVKSKASNGDGGAGRYDPMMEEVIDDELLNEEEEGEGEESEEAVLVEKPKAKAKGKAKSKAMKGESDLE